MKGEPRDIINGLQMKMNEELLRYKRQEDQ